VTPMSAHSSEAPRDGGGRKKRILIVDDEIDITSSIKLGLERKGFVVDAYNNPIEVLLKAKPGEYDLAIFDIRMPRMTGFELYRRFRNIDSEVDVCFMTAYDIYATEFKTMFPEVEVVGFFKKPVSIGTLIEEINRLLERDKHEGRAQANKATVRS
jgi:two-component system, OmpR family, response regulator ChvI